LNSKRQRFYIECQSLDRNRAQAATAAAATAARRHRLQLQQLDQRNLQQQQQLQSEPLQQFQHQQLYHRPNLRHHMLRAYSQYDDCHAAPPVVMEMRVTTR
jgi:hypothetical protein